MLETSYPYTNPFIWLGILLLAGSLLCTKSFRSSLGLSIQRNFWIGILFAVLFALSATYVSSFSLLKSLAVSPLVLGLLAGMAFSALAPKAIPSQWNSGISFCAKKLLRLGIILYGFRVSFDGIAAVSWPGFFAALCTVTTILLVGTLAGRYVFGLDTHSSLLISSGSAICGVTAILAVEPVIRAKAHKSAMAVSVIVVFGTLAMFLYPLLYRLGFLELSEEQMALFIGATIHDSAHVVGAGAAISPTVAEFSIIVKMLRVLLLTPVLFLLSVLPIKEEETKPLLHTPKHKKQKVTVPCFALVFLFVIILHSYFPLSAVVVKIIKSWSAFFLTTALTSLGLQTDFKQFAQSTPRAFSLGLLIFAILFAGGYSFVQVLI